MRQRLLWSAEFFLFVVTLCYQSHKAGAFADTFHHEINFTHPWYTAYHSYSTQHLSHETSSNVQHENHIGHTGTQIHIQPQNVSDHSSSQQPSSQFVSEIGSLLSYILNAAGQHNATQHVSTSPELQLTTPLPTPFSVQPVLKANCSDEVPKCSSYGPSICFGVYSNWARIKCEYFCAFCKSASKNELTVVANINHLIGQLHDTGCWPY